MYIHTYVRLYKNKMYYTLRIYIHTYICMYDTSALAEGDFSNGLHSPEVNEQILGSVNALIFMNSQKQYITETLTYGSVLNSRRKRNHTERISIGR